MRTKAMILETVTIVLPAELHMDIRRYLYDMRSQAAPDEVVARAVEMWLQHARQQGHRRREMSNVDFNGRLCFFRTARTRAPGAAVRPSHAVGRTSESGARKVSFPPTSTRSTILL